MDIAILTQFFKHLTIFVGVIYFLTSILFIFAQDLLISVQKKVIDFDDETLKKFLYGFVAIFKLLFIVFILGPYISLLLMS